ncbi:M15 family metallopeptidase [Verrucomicrobiaceae bacterium 5K15]|uniref:D-alanyl-D-alanine dipeptidase n=1 Tax=Oceaniferula flava TaxID=2800421 RepID=A0AAE2SDT6_9BACT|nr:M15 family metallopeptidase [Oceaniferula flavus]MBM1137662.1 M15 family metallopeptidase [Oceaniferula flavus]
MRLLLLSGWCCLLAACSNDLNDDLSSPPISSDPLLAKVGLIDVLEVDRTLKVDLQYKRPSPISSRPLYAQDFQALLKPATALRLKEANRLVKAHGYRILVWDAYRPPSAQLELWNASGYNDTYVANPHNAPSQHSCGTAVDVTLVTSRGKPVKMPTGFDSVTPEAASHYQHSDPEIARNVRILQSAMRRAGFYPLPAEWWHYIDRDYRQYPETIPLSAVRPRG